VYAFRGTVLGDKAHTFPLYGFGPDRQYRLHFQDDSSSDRTESGADLQKKGLSVALTVPDSSELVFIDEVG
jgi:hypothetical protein